MPRDFDGITDYLSGSLSAPSLPFTMFCWFRADAAQDAALIGFRTSNQYFTAGVATGATDNVFLSVNSKTPVNEARALTSTEYTVSQWHAICARMFVAGGLQHAAPASDISLGSWVELNGDGDAFAWDELNDGLVGGQGDLGAQDFSTTAWRSVANPTNDQIECKLVALTDPVSSTGHTLYAVVFKNSSGGRQIDCIVTLLDGTTTIASVTSTNIPNTATLVQLTLSAAQANSIANYDDLRIRVDMNDASGSGAARTGVCTAMQFQCPGGNSRSIRLDGAGASSNLVNVEPGAASTFEVGGTNAGSDLFNGQIAWATVWSVALSDVECAALEAGISPWKIRPHAVIGMVPIWGEHSPEIDLFGTTTYTVTGTPSKYAGGPPMEIFRPRPLGIPLVPVGDVFEDSITLAASGNISNQPDVIAEASMSLGMSSGLSEGTDLSAEAAATMSAIAALTQQGNLNIDTAMALAASMATNMLGGLIVGNTVTFNVQGDLSAASDAVIEGAITLSSQEDLTQVADAVFETLISLGTSANVDMTGAVDILGAITLLVNSGITISGGLDVSGTIALPSQVGLSASVVATIEDVIALSGQVDMSLGVAVVIASLINLPTSVGVSLSSLGTLITGSATFPVSVGYSTTGGILFEETLTLSAQGDMATARDVTVDEAIILAISSAIAVQEALLAAGSITLPVTVDISESGSVTVPVAISLGTQLGVASSGGILFEETISLAAQAAFAETATVTIEGIIAFEAQQGINIATALDALSSINLAAAVDIAKTGNLTITSALTFSADLTANVVGERDVSVDISLGMVAEASPVAQLIVPASITLPASAAAVMQAALAIEGSISLSVLATIAFQLEPTTQIVRHVAMLGETPRVIALGKKSSPQLIARTIRARFFGKLEDE